MTFKNFIQHYWYHLTTLTGSERPRKEAQRGEIRRSVESIWFLLRGDRNSTSGHTCREHLQLVLWSQCGNTLTTVKCWVVGRGCCSATSQGAAFLPVIFFLDKVHIESKRKTKDNHHNVCPPEEYQILLDLGRVQELVFIHCITKIWLKVHRLSVVRLYLIHWLRLVYVRRCVCTIVPM